MKLIEAMKLAQNDFGWAGGHFVIYPSGKFDDAGQGHEEFFKNEAYDLLENKANEKNLEQIKKLALKELSYLHLDEDDLDIDTLANEAGEIVCFYFGYIRISTSPMKAGKKFVVGINYLRSKVSSRGLKTMKVFLETMVDTFGKTLGNFGVVIDDSGNPEGGKVSSMKPVMDII